MDKSQVIIADSAGYCFGVKRAIQMVEDAASKHETVYSLGPIIHNPQVVEKLAKNGVITVNEISEIPDDSVVLVRSHGVVKENYEVAKEKRLELFDATCPFVKKPQQLVQELCDSGYKTVVVGKPNHPEVVGLVSYGDSAVVFDPSKGFDNILGRIKELFNVKPEHKFSKLAFVSQTTIKVEDFSKVVAESIIGTEVVKVHNTICNATRNIQDSTRALAKKVDVMIIVGGRNSSNTSKLFEISKDEGIKAFFVETAEEIEDNWITKNDLVGISAGASTPEWIIENVYNKLITLNPHL